MKPTRRQLAPTLVAYLTLLPGSFGDEPIGAAHFPERATDPELLTVDAGQPGRLLPMGVTSFGSCVLDGWLYVYGGYFGRVHGYRAEHQSPHFYRINLHDHGSVELLPNGKVGIQGAELIEHRGKLICVGGMEVRDGETHSTGGCRSFDPETLRWTDLPALPAPRSSHNVAIVGERLYVVGGWSLAGAGEGHWYERMWSLDLSLEQPEWQSHPQPFQRRGAGLAVGAGRLAYIGGIRPDREVSNQVDLFDPQSGGWSRGPDVPGFGFGLAAASIADAVYTSGQQGGVYRWQRGDADWKLVARLTFPRFFHQMVATGENELTVLGGIDDNRCRPRHIETVTLGEQHSVPGQARVVAHWTLPHPGTAKNRMGLFLRDDSLYLFGGNNSVGQHDFESDNFLADAWKLDLNQLRFTPMVDYPAKRQTMQTVVGDNGRLGWSVGGFGHDGGVARTWDDSYSYDFKRRRWKEQPALPRPRSQFGLAAHQGHLYVFGGLDYDPTRPRKERFHHLSSVLRWKIGSDDGYQTLETEMPGTRRAFASAVLGERYYIVCGMREEFQLVEENASFDFSTSTWQEMAPAARTRLSGNLVALRGHLFLAGGSSPVAGGDDLEPNRSIEMYEPDGDRWSTVLGEVPIQPRHMRMVAWREHLLLFSAHEKDLSRVSVVLIRPPPPASISGS